MRSDKQRRHIRAYKKARRKFAITAYMLTAFWITLALIQWLLVTLIYDIRKVFLEYYWISVIFFTISMLLACIFVFFKKVRFIKGLNWVLAILIVEFVIIGVFALVARTWWPDMLLFFGICALLLFIFILIGSVISHDITLDVVTLFVLAFTFVVVTVFVIMLYMLLFVPYTFLVYQIIISIIVLMFVMYHAQTINGGRFAEMRLYDYLLASLILFFDFLILYILTFYAQILYRWATPDSVIRESSVTPWIFPTGAGFGHHGAGSGEVDESEESGSGSNGGGGAGGAGTVAGGGGGGGGDGGGGTEGVGEGGAGAGAGKGNGGGGGEVNKGENRGLELRAGWLDSLPTSKEIVDNNKSNKTNNNGHEVFPEDFYY